MKRLVIVGAGGHGKVVADTASQMRIWDEIVFVDKRWPELQECADWSVVSNDLSKDSFQLGAEFVVAVGCNEVRYRLYKELVVAGFSPVRIIHPSASVSKYAKVGDGTVVFAGAVINIDSVINEACIVNTRASIDHDCVLGAAVHVSPGANLGGGIHIGEFSWIGIGACVRQQINIGKCSIIGAGAAVVADVEAFSKVVGVPAKIKK